MGAYIQSLFALTDCHLLSRKIIKEEILVTISTLIYLQFDRKCHCAKKKMDDISETLIDQGTFLPPSSHDDLLTFLDVIIN